MQLRLTQLELDVFDVGKRLRRSAELAGKCIIVGGSVKSWIGSPIELSARRPRKKGPKQVKQVIYLGSSKRRCPSTNTSNSSCSPHVEFSLVEMIYKDPARTLPSDTLWKRNLEILNKMLTQVWWCLKLVAGDRLVNLRHCGANEQSSRTWMLWSLDKAIWNA